MFIAAVNYCYVNYLVTTKFIIQVFIKTFARDIHLHQILHTKVQDVKCQSIEMKAATGGVILKLYKLFWSVSLSSHIGAACFIKAAGVRALQSVETG